MLTMPSVSSMPSPTVARPVLVAEAVRPALPVRAIEPTTAISKERSRVENKAPEASLAAASAIYTPSAQVLEVYAKGEAATRERNAERTARNAQAEQPPAEKSEIQKALEVQVKELLSNVWKASAKAVDFLLQREPKTGEATPVSAGSTDAGALALRNGLEPRAGGGPPSAAGQAVRLSLSTGPYTPQGVQKPDDNAAAGQLLDVLA